jgi:hypothetical protein
MAMPRLHFRSAYGDAGGAGASSNPLTDWLYAHRNEFWFDDAGYVFLILGPTGLQTVYTPAARPLAKFYPAASAGPIVDVLRSRGRRAADWELAAVKAGRPVFAATRTPTRTAAPATVTVFAPPAAAAPRGESAEATLLPFYQRAWFPFAAGGAALVLLIGVTMAVRSRRAA